MGQAGSHPQVLHGQWQFWDRGWEEGVNLEGNRGMEPGWCQEKREYEKRKKTGEKDENETGRRRRGH